MTNLTKIHISCYYDLCKSSEVTRDVISFNMMLNQLFLWYPKEFQLWNKSWMVRNSLNCWKKTVQFYYLLHTANNILYISKLTINIFRKVIYRYTTGLMHNFPRVLKLSPINRKHRIYQNRTFIMYLMKFIILRSCYAKPIR